MSSQQADIRRVLAPGRDFDGPELGEILERIACEAELTAEELAALLSDPAAWSDCTIPEGAIPWDQVLQRSGLGALLGALDLLDGLKVNYLSATSICISPGQVAHRGQARRLVGDCDDQDSCEEEHDTADILMPGECVSTEDNPSGLDSDLWYYLYGKLDEAGTAPIFRISPTRPTRCLGFGWEHPTEKYARFLGSIRTMASGEIRPFERSEDGTVTWRQAAAGSDYQSDGAHSGGTALGTTTAGWARYDAATTGSAYHDGDKHVAPSADYCHVTMGDTANSGGLGIRSVNDASPASAGYIGATGSGDGRAWVKMPVNMPDLAAADRQTFYFSCTDALHSLDVVGYHEPR